MASDSENNKAVVRALMQAFSECDLERWLSMMHDDATYEIMGSSVMSGLYTKEQISAATQELLKVFPQGIQIHERSLTAEGDRVSMEATGTATSIAGAQYNNTYHFMFVVRDGKLVEGREYLDTKLVDQLLANN